MNNRIKSNQLLFRLVSCTAIVVALGIAEPTISEAEETTRILQPAELPVKGYRFGKSCALSDTSFAVICRPEDLSFRGAIPNLNGFTGVLFGRFKDGQWQFERINEETIAYHAIAAGHRGEVYIAGIPGFTTGVDKTTIVIQCRNADDLGLRWKKNYQVESFELSTPRITANREGGVTLKYWHLPGVNRQERIDTMASFDATGNLLWKHTFATDNQDRISFADLTSHTDGQIVVTGHSRASRIDPNFFPNSRNPSGNFSVVIQTFDSRTGKPLQQKWFGSTATATVKFVRPIDHSRVLVAGHMTGPLKGFLPKQRKHPLPYQERQPFVVTAPDDLSVLQQNSPAPIDITYYDRRLVDVFTESNGYHILMFIHGNLDGRDGRAFTPRRHRSMTLLSYDWKGKLRREVECARSEKGRFNPEMSMVPLKHGTVVLFSGLGRATVAGKSFDPGYNTCRTYMVYVPNFPM